MKTFRFKGCPKGRIHFSPVFSKSFCQTKHEFVYFVHYVVKRNLFSYKQQKLSAIFQILLIVQHALSKFYLMRLTFVFVWS